MARGARLFHFRARLFTSLVRRSVFASESVTIVDLCFSTHRIVVFSFSTQRLVAQSLR